MPFQVGPLELILVLVVALVVLGPKRLPEAGKSLGRGLREFKSSISDVTSTHEVAATSEAHSDDAAAKPTS